VQKFQLVLLLHAHQPVGNFEDVFESAYAKAYRPFLETLARHPSIRIGLHYTGSLLEWIERSHPEYFDRLRELAQRGQIEIVGGGFYEPILIAIPPEDGREQIERLADYIEKHFGKRPAGAWLAERVWEPQVPSLLEPAGVEYTLVDDNHFLGAGFELDWLYGYYIAEDQGKVVRVLPGLKALRYLIPFHGVDEVASFLRQTAAEHPGGFAATGDDLEKFGVWPGTYEHCYRNGWLENFFAVLEESCAWLETSAPANAIRSHSPMGRADLPTASYTEMMEWSLPTAARSRYHSLTQEFSSRPDDLPFVRGGIWRNFFSKYSESNLLQKKMLYVSAKLRRLASGKRLDPDAAKLLREATTLLLRSQCNDSYWHGIFGGLYSPHLRTAAWRALIEAEALADRLSHRTHEYADVAQLDFDLDGREEIYFTSERYAALLLPHDGGTICALDCRSSDVRGLRGGDLSRAQNATVPRSTSDVPHVRCATAALINSLKRRPESYHAKIRSGFRPNAPTVQSIHEQMRTKEDGLERWLHYDRWCGHSFRLLLFGCDKTHHDCALVQLGEHAALAGGPYVASEILPERVSLVSQNSADWPAKKSFSFLRTPSGFEVVCEVVLRRMAQGTASVKVGLEVVVNFLAPAAPDRYFETDGRRFPLRWAATVPASPLRVVDEWQKVSVTLAAPSAGEFWVCPIETVSESEDGFERIYQGSKIVAVWPIELSSGSEWRGRLAFQVAHLEG
jgi:4-alpha-glucanotransferase